MSSTLARAYALVIRRPHAPVAKAGDLVEILMLETSNGRPHRCAARPHTRPCRIRTGSTRHGPNSRGRYVRASDSGRPSPTANCLRE
jgi:hypothetical protein